MLRLVPAAAFLLLIGPVAAGLLGILLPAFGYLPALGHPSFSLDAFRELARLPGLSTSCALSLFTGLAATLTAFSLVILFVAGARHTRAFRRIERLVSPLLSVPHAAAAFGFALLIAPSGFVVRLLSPWATGWERPPDLLLVNDPYGLALTAGLVAKEIPFLFLVTLASLPQARASEMARIASSLGYGRILGFLHAVLPGLYRQIRLPILAVLAYATSNVEMALILGPTTPAPLAVRVLQLRADTDLGGWLAAAAGAVLQLGLTAAALLVWVAGEKVVASLARAAALSGRRLAGDGAARFLAGAFISLVSALVLAGIALLALWSVSGYWRFPDALPQTFTLDVWRRVLPGLAVPFADTLLLGFSTAVVAVALALATLEHEARAGRTPTQRAMAALYLPLIVPQIAFLFGLETLVIRLDLDGVGIAVALAHLVFVFPYAWLALRDPWRSWDSRHALVARSLGHGPNAVFWRIRLPMLLRPVLTAAAIGFAVSVGLYLPTLLVGAGRWPTVTTEAVALASGGDRRVIGATALVQALLPALGFSLALLVPALVFRNRRALRSA